jgi:hypothetical protein
MKILSVLVLLMAVCPCRDGIKNSEFSQGSITGFVPVGTVLRLM